MPGTTVGVIETSNRNDVGATGAPNGRGANSERFFGPKSREFAIVFAEHCCPAGQIVTRVRAVGCHFVRGLIWPQGVVDRHYHHWDGTLFAVKTCDHKIVRHQ